jgi:hypothetical protein
LLANLIVHVLVIHSLQSISQHSGVITEEQSKEAR